ncbi:MAG: hypothetical protein GJ680_18465 [Alteromonadaceae bacterium]|nr:hypothetical protein [Alteromonadaceae bacterium]
MRIKLISCVVIFFLFVYDNAYAGNHVAAISEDASSLVVRVTISYQLGDNDSPSDARTMAIDLAKQLAAEYAGSYVETETQITNDTITLETITTLSTAIMRLTVTDESFDVTNSGLRFILVGEAALDKASLMAKLGSLSHSAEQQATIEALQIEAQALRTQVKNLSQELNQTSDLGARLALTKERLDAIGQLSRTHEVVKRTFAKGSLLAMAKSDSTAQQKALDQLAYFFDNLSHFTTLTVAEPLFRRTDSGFDVVVGVDWHINEAIIERDFAPLASPRNDGAEVTWLDLDNTSDDQITPYSSVFLTELKKHKVSIEVGIGEYKSSLTIASPVHCHVICNPSTKSNGYAFIFSSNESSSKKLEWKETNPLTITGIPESVLSNVTDITASINVEN